MISHSLATPEGAVRRLQPYSERIFKAWRDALAAANAVFWDADGRELLPYEPWLFCHHARTHAIHNLNRELAGFADVHVDENTIMSSVLLRTEDGVQVLFRKSDEGEVPATDSEKRQRWCTQALPGLEEEMEELHLIATWDVDPETRELIGFELSMPAHAGPSRASNHMHWDAYFVQVPEQRIADLEAYRRKAVPKRDTGTSASDQ
jgi:hypothetical protein